MRDEQVYVIKNKDGYYLNADYKALFSGITSGFVFYTSEKKLKEDLISLGEGFYSEQVNLNDISDGKRIYNT